MAKIVKGRRASAETGRALGAFQEISAAYEKNRQQTSAADVIGFAVYVPDGEVF
jgi:hypothetical protein